MHIFRSVFAFARRKILHGHGTHGTHSSILSIGSCWPITKIHTFCPCCVSGAFHINFKCSWKTEMRNLQKTEIAPSVPFTLFSKSSCEINALSQQFPMNCQSNCKSRDNSCSYFLLQYFQSEHEAFINIGSTYCCAWAGVVGMVPTMILLYSRFHMPEYQVISLLPLYIKLQYIYIYILAKYSHIHFTALGIPYHTRLLYPRGKELVEEDLFPTFPCAIWISSIPLPGIRCVCVGWSKRSKGEISLLSCTNRKLIPSFLYGGWKSRKNDQFPLLSAFTFTTIHTRVCWHSAKIFEVYKGLLEECSVPSVFGMFHRGQF